MIARDELVKSTFSIVVCVCSGKSQDEMKPTKSDSCLQLEEPIIHWMGQEIKPTNSDSCLQLEEPSIHWMGQGPMHS